MTMVDSSKVTPESIDIDHDACSDSQLWKANESSSSLVSSFFISFDSIDTCGEDLGCYLESIDTSSLIFSVRVDDDVTGGNRHSPITDRVGRSKKKYTGSTSTKQQEKMWFDMQELLESFTMNAIQEAERHSGQDEDDIDVYSFAQDSLCLMREKRR